MRARQNDAAAAPFPAGEPARCSGRANGKKALAASGRSAAGLTAVGVCPRCGCRRALREDGCFRQRKGCAGHGPPGFPSRPRGFPEHGFSPAAFPGSAKGPVNTREIQTGGMKGPALIKQHRGVFGKRRSLGYAAFLFCGSFGKGAGRIPARLGNVCTLFPVFLLFWTF